LPLTFNKHDVQKNPLYSLITNFAMYPFACLVPP